MKLFTIFHLDGVLIDNVACERAVTEPIVKAMSLHHDLFVGNGASSGLP